MKIVAAGYGISFPYVHDLLGPHEFVDIHCSDHIIERCVVAPGAKNVDVLETAADLAAAALARVEDGRGAVLIILPGMQEICEINHSDTS